MFSLQTDMMMLEFLSALRRRMTELEPLDSMDCPECSGPPPMFRLPPPPRPPFLTEASFCSEAPLAELEDCVAIPMIDASYHANPSLQNTALIITCAVILLLMAAIVSVVFWKHKRKVQNILPCKSAAAAAAGRGRVLTNGQTLPGAGTVAGNTLLYEDLMESTVHSQIHNHLPPQSHAVVGVQPTIEMLDVNNEKSGRGAFVCSSPGPDPYASQDLYNPVYEELCNGEHHPESDEEGELNTRNRSHHQLQHHPHHHLHHHHHHHRASTSKSASEDEFAEDELSVGEPSESRMLTASSGPVTWGTCPATASKISRERRGRRSPRSLDRRRKNKGHDVGEFHEGMLLDALLHLYPNVAGVAGARTNASQRQKSVSSVAHKLPYFVPPMPPMPTVVSRCDENPYESVPVLGPLHHYTNQTRSNKDKLRKTSSITTTTATTTSTDHYEKYPSAYGTEYFGLHSSQTPATPIYTQVGSDYSDTYAQPSDKLYYNEDKYTQPVYYTSRDPDQLSTGKLYQGQPDSSFGSDSGYSHHTSNGGGGGGGITTSNCISGQRSSINRTNHRKDKHRNSNHSQHSVDFIFS